MAIFGTEQAKVLLPREIADGMVKKTMSTSTIAKLSASEPMRFGKTDIIVFNDLPKAEFVEEGGDKGSTTGGFSSVTVVPHKAQVTMRFNQEVKWADEDYQLGVLNELASAGADALSRALDLGVFHRINPLTGTEISTWSNYVGATTKRVEIGAGTSEIDDDFRAAVGLVINDAANPAQVTGAAFDPKFSWGLSNLKTKDGAGTTSQLRYPTLGFGTAMTDFMGIPVAVGSTVSGVPEATDTKVRAIVGDFQDGLRWGIQRELPLELITYGDPDGQGDLRRKNQIALRLELVYAWHAFAERFAIIEDKS
ncbi:phage major capsid family protein [Actinomyces culturomici]|uniref:phage major capsid family protein n=1 Tax=Actinomyces culturomici TaxID=1926276 RepID=UPI000E1FBD4A|nr:phage major capsid protein [Actinomyces culturomici]